MVICVLLISVGGQKNAWNSRPIGSKSVLWAPQSVKLRILKKAGAIIGCRPTPRGSWYCLILSDGNTEAHANMQSCAFGIDRIRILHNTCTYRCLILDRI